MPDSDIYKELLTSLIKKQMLLLGPKVAIERLKNIPNLKVAEDGSVIEIGSNPTDITDQVFEAFTDFPSRIAAREIINAKTEQTEKVKDQIASGWLMMEQEKSKLQAAVDHLALGFITADEGLAIIQKNPAAEAILGISSQPGGWTINEIQSNITTAQYFLPIECNKCMESQSTLPPQDITFQTKNLRFFLSPIINIAKQTEVVGVTILIQDLGPLAVPLAAEPQPEAFQ